MLDTSDIYIICYPECQRIEPTTVFVQAILLKQLILISDNLSAGISPEAILSYNDWIGSEEVRFFSYNMKRTAGTLVLQSLLPFGKIT